MREVFFQKRGPDDDEPEPVGPDDEREWRTEANLIRRTNAELERVKRQMDTYKKMSALWDQIQANWQDYRNRMRWDDGRP